MENKEERSPAISVKQPTFDLFTKIEKIYGTKDSTVFGIRTGFSDLDHLLAGLRPSNLIVLASRPGMGKTSFALNIANHLTIKEKKSVLYANLADSKEEITMKSISSEGMIDSHELYNGMLQEKDWGRLVQAADRFSASQLNVLNIPIFDIRKFLDILRNEHREKQYSLIIIDYIQIINGSATYAGNRTQEISDISRSLKQLSAELNVPILVLSQLSRNLESRMVKKPLLSDLRDSGSLEDDADVVLFLHRDEYHNPDSDKLGITEIIVAKNRTGPLDTALVYFHKQFCKYSNLSKVTG